MKKRGLRLLVLAVFPLLYGWSGISQDRFVVSGHVSDAETGENLIGATVFVAGTSLGTASNSYGFYSLTIPAGEVVLVCSYIGYRGIQMPLTITGSQTFDLKLESLPTLIEEVVVKAERADQRLRTAEIGVEKVDMASIARLPVLFGERDLLKTLQLLPGISTVAEGGTGFSVRGGSIDQNLILLDEAPVYSSSHLMGFFSVFNADAVKDVSVFKGGIPANYGGRASSVVDIQMRDGNNQKFSATGGIGLISSRLTLEGPIVKDRGSFIISGRRSYADLMARLAGYIDNNMGLYFYDLNAKFNYRINENNRLYLSAYNGADDFSYEDFGINWGNNTLTARWNHLFGPRLFSNTTFIYSNYDYAFNIMDAIKMSAGIENLGLKEDMSFFLNPENSLKFGLQSTYHRFSPGELVPDDPDSSFVPKIVLPEKKALESGVYVSNEMKIGERFAANYGFRFSMFNQIGEGNTYSFNELNERIDSVHFEAGEIMQTYTAFEPRISLNYRLGNKHAFKASYNRMAQYLHLLSNATSGQPTDTWVPSTTNIKPVIVNQVSAGYFRNFLDNMLEFSLEAYYKDMDAVTDYEDGTNVLFNEDVEASILAGDGRSYGAEVYLKKKNGAFTGWLSYTLARTEKRIEGINYGHWYSTTYDKTHDLSVVLSYQLSKRIALSGAWVYYTGNAVTFPSGKYTFDGHTLSYYTERNGYRMPDYHRLDLSLHIDGRPGKRFESGWNFSVYNVYNRHNAYIISFQESESMPGRTEAVRLSLFGVVPSLTWNFKF